jgi:transposase
MQTKREKLSYAMMLLPSLEEFVPADDRLRKLDRVLDLRFVHEAVRDRYCQDNGRPCLDPEVVIRLFVLQAIEGIHSVRELMRQVHANLTYRWFIGYTVTEPVPDHSTLSRALDRFGNEVFDRLFSLSIAQCQRSGLIEGKVLHLDATLIRADLDASHVNKPESADPDARFGRGPGGRKIPGYKQQTVADGKTRVVVAVSVMPADRHDHEGAIAAVDQATGRLGQTPQAVCADAAYANGPNRAALAECGIRLVSPPRRIDATGQEEQRYGVDAFAYDATDDVYICPAGERLSYAGTESTRSRRRRYRAPVSVCTACAFKSRCTTSRRKMLQVGPHHHALSALRADAQTASFRTLYRSRAPVIEGVFAEGKQWHGLRRAARRGLCNMLIQSLLIAAVLNYKRLAAFAGADLRRLIAAMVAWWPRDGRKAQLSDRRTKCATAQVQWADAARG